ncbi:MAG: bacterial transcriptional activator domain-containing protein [Alcanivoracaceae bacterium]
MWSDRMFAGFRDMEWLDECRSQMRLRLAQMFLRGLRTAQQSADTGSVERLANVLLADDPTCEPAWRALIQMHLQSNDQVLARKVLERCNAVLEKELGVGPSAETLALLTTQG